MAGRQQESVRTGKTDALAEFMNKNWDLMVGRTNEDVAQELGYKASNMISMWRTGKTRISLERLPDIARLMKVDLAVLLPLWFEQYWGDRDDATGLMTTVFKRLASVREVPLISALRDLRKSGDRRYTRDQILAVTAVISDDAICAKVLKFGRARGLIPRR
jgi:transcriptional regulator with XRE-family HTH domain